MVYKNKSLLSIEIGQDISRCGYGRQQGALFFAVVILAAPAYRNKQGNDKKAYFFH